MPTPLSLHKTWISQEDVNTALIELEMDKEYKGEVDRLHSGLTDSDTSSYNSKFSGGWPWKGEKLGNIPYRYSVAYVCTKRVISQQVRLQTKLSTGLHRYLNKKV